jgi:hypothetical protein
VVHPRKADPSGLAGGFRVLVCLAYRTLSVESSAPTWMGVSEAVHFSSAAAEGAQSEFARAQVRGPCLEGAEVLLSPVGVPLQLLALQVVKRYDQSP